ncbi:hypothetical protein [Arthrobacter sp. ISL-95]|uniref:hypothetical protein n=1 Tax=Arthrobacter sp. ISL-95 TaxID=2819116 RepID=UPI001BEA2412|nr:hypothetical protein [Arthrobacter sp. ISL-95]MBT2587975.1 hypothetical protein [Arthrobacter sp. ISL-95]
MSVFKKSSTITAAAPTLEERSNAAAATAASALSIFQLAAGDLDRAANELTEVRNEAEEEAARLLEISDAAEQQAFQNRLQATKIREFVGAAE